MSSLRYSAIRFVLSAITASRMDRLAAPATRGLGCILTFHRVTRDAAPMMPENAGLAITPEFLDETLREVRRLGYDIIPLDDLPARMEVKGERPFVVLTFDDGYRDLAQEALPVLKAHSAPFAAFICTGFADHQAPLWWLDLEEVMARLDFLDLTLPYGSISLPARWPEEKQAALHALYWRLRGLSESQFRQVLEGLMFKYRVEPSRRVSTLCMTWEEIAVLAREPLVTIGAHSMTHPRLGAQPIEDAEREMRVSRDIIAAHLGITPRHFCYPVGDAASAGAREAEIARRLGYVTALTTRADVLHSKANMQLLPRISVNGLFQKASYLRALMSGLPFVLK